MKPILVVVACLILALAFLKGARAQTACTRTGQVGCISLDIGVYKAPNSDPGHYAAADKKPSGMAYYWGYKAGEVQPSARRRSFTIYFWNVTNVSSDRMAEYRPPNGWGKRSNPPPLPRLSVTEIAVPKNAPRLDPAFKLGTPQRVFRVTSDGGPGVSFQVPWEFLTADTWIFICSEDQDVVYPNKMSREGEGIWVGPQHHKTWVQQSGAKFDFVTLRPNLFLN